MIRGFPRDYKYKFKTGFLLKIDSFKNNERFWKIQRLGLVNREKQYAQPAQGPWLKTIMRNVVYLISPSYLLRLEYNPCSSDWEFRQASLFVERSIVRTFHDSTDFFNLYTCRKTTTKFGVENSLLEPPNANRGSISYCSSTPQFVLSRCKSF